MGLEVKYKKKHSSISSNIVLGINPFGSSIKMLRYTGHGDES